MIIALAGLYASGASFIGKPGLAAAMAVVSAVIAVPALLPAMLGPIGRRIDRYEGAAARRRARRRARSTGRGSSSRRGIRTVVVLATPLLSSRLGHIGDGADPASFTDRRAYDLMTNAFGPGRP